MGLAIGVLMHGMPVGEAFKTYAILTVGDGLVTQIPAVIISIASAMLLSKGGRVGSTDLALIHQLGGYPAALATVALLMGLFAFVPGLPFVPFVIGAGCLGGAAFLAQSTMRKAAAEKVKAAPETRAAEIADAGRSAGCRRDPHGILAEPGAGGDGRGDRPGFAHPEHAQPYRDRVRADHAGDPADRQSGAGRGDLPHPHPGRGGGAQRAGDRQGAGAAARRRHSGP